MTITEILKQPFKIMTQPKHLKVLVKAYKDELDKNVCISCRGSLNEMIITLKKYYNMSNYELTGNAYYRLSKDSSATINNKNITDDLAEEFLRLDPSRIRLFDKYPSDWEIRLDVDAAVEAAENEITDFDPINELNRLQLEEYKLPELRKMYPHIKSISKSGFIDEILNNQ
jgi:hypothetical protein